MECEVEWSRVEREGKQRSTRRIEVSCARGLVESRERERECCV